MSDAVRTGVIIVDHGSKRDEANAMLHAVADLYRDLTGTAIVEPAHMELAEPTIAQAFAQCVEQGAQRVVVALYFLSPGRHSRRDIPALVAEAAAAHPGIAFAVTEPLGLDTRIAEVLHARVDAAAAALEPRP